MTMADIKPRLRIGYATPHPLNDTLQYDFYLVAPPRIMMMTAGLEISDYSREAVEDQLPVLDRRIGSLMRRGAQRIVVSGVPVAISLGMERMRRLLSEISDKWKVPADTDLEAIIAAARHMGARRLAIATRWKPPVNEKLSSYLADAGLETAGIANSGRSMEENAGLDDETGIRLAIDLGREALEKDRTAEGLIMPGGRWLTLGAVLQIEEEFKVPVIVNHTASLWAALDAAGIHEPIVGWGRLLAPLQPQPQSGGRA
jgi:arylmalonate decarboxylase